MDSSSVNCFSPVVKANTREVDESVTEPESDLPDVKKIDITPTIVVDASVTEAETDSEIDTSQELKTYRRATCTNHPLPLLDDLKFSLHPDDPDNFLKVCYALRILVRRVICDTEINEADRLHREYTAELIKTNNHADGELETTFLCEFQRTCQTSRLTFSLLSYPKDSLPCEAAEIMLKASREERGTVAGLAALSEDLDNVQTDAMQTFSRVMSTETYRTLARTLCFRFPYTPVHCRGDEPLVRNSTPLDREETFYEYVVVNGRRYHASRTVGSNSSSLFHVTIPRAVPVATYGELSIRTFCLVWAHALVQTLVWHAQQTHQWTYADGSLESTPIETPNFGDDRTKVWATIIVPNLSCSASRSHPQPQSTQPSTRHTSPSIAMSRLRAYAPGSLLISSPVLKTLLRLQTPPFHFVRPPPH
ncbi:hypothetical protein DFJ58DRAFT_730304 [Suillus subalutaceus]|uniref:uncharacterized protein n=1 Tax=Suillus subalutaceus TaxID=48586 RepID=UPI001B85B804|nr:uncharacterized protein DFJ58DRAFT_730304 [Suillus subalutaceus]KAG1846974.1 hypothetical protein DFJ58DRAFT_730304 [Suillus subalutaceus]